MTPAQADDRQWRLAKARAKNAETGAITKGRVYYERSAYDATYLQLSRSARQEYEYAARYDRRPDPQNDWRRI